ncbi:glutamate mutase L [candidate division WOR-3 bacterium]|nr:glutamate mutase L [candidate division WOR-3 bacterium]
MRATSFPPDPSEFCITDVGSTTTKALLFLRQAGAWQSFRYETPTTVEKPHEDVTVGVLAALRGLEQLTGRTLVRDDAPAVPYLTTSSAGGGLAMVVTGLVYNLTAGTAHRAALGAGAIVLDCISMDDGRTPYRRIEDLKRLRPDMVLVAGGFEGDAVSAPVFLAELLVEAGLRPKLNPSARMPVIYAGNTRAADHVREALGDGFLFRAVPNLRPELETENLEPARAAIHELFMDHVMSQAPGYEKLKQWVAAPIVPTPAAFGSILKRLATATGHRILAVDIGGATTDVFTARTGDVFRTVSANLGLSYSILNVAKLAGISPMRELYHPHLSDAAMWNLIGNKYVHPTRLARTPDEMLSEWAAAVVAIREAVRQHLKLRDGVKQEAGPVRVDLDDLLKGPRMKPRPATRFTYTECDLLIGSGGILSHSPRPAASTVLLDALSPADGVELALDSEFMFPHLGALAQVNPGLAVELAQRLGMVKLDRATGRPHAGYVPPPRAADVAETRPAMTRGEIRLRRELVIPGQVFVSPGQAMNTETLVARSVRQFLRPFFLHVAQELAVPAADVEKYLVKHIGDEVGIGDVVARTPRRVTGKTFRSPVAGRVEKLLPGGTLFLRERPEEAREFTAVQVAKELDVEPVDLAPHLRVRTGDEVDRGQWLAAILAKGDFRASASPVRGKVNRIDKHFGIVLIEPLLEELEVKAWLPGTVESVSEHGCTVVSGGTVISGVWGSGGETAGTLTFSAVAAGKVVVRDFADSVTITQAKELNASGIICAGVNMQEIIEPFPPFTIVVLEGFGEQKLSDEVRTRLAEHEGRLALLDGTTQLRVGVRRPQIILPDQREGT